MTADVSPEGQAALTKEYDEVVLVEYLETKVKLTHGGKRFRDFYDNWLGKCFTKFHAFELERFKKV